MSGNSGVLDKRRSTSGGGKERRLYSLVEVAQETGIPMPILLRYKREHPDRVPSEGSGSQQRFPEEAFEVLRQIHREEAEGRELPRRGGFGLLSLPRLRKQVRPSGDEEEEAATAAAAGESGAAPTVEAAPAGDAPRQRPAAARRAAGAGEGELLSLVDISSQVDIPYPTLARYASQYADRIPHQGKGRARRFPPEAVDVFRQIRKESKPGRPPKAKKRQAAAGPAAPVRKPAAEPAPAPSPEPAAGGPWAGVADENQLARRIASLEESQRALEGQIRELLDVLSKPASVTVQ